LPLSPIQESFFHGSRIDTHHYNQAVILYVPERLEEEGTRKLFAVIQAHHDALRMTYKKEDGQVVQTNHGLDYPLSLELFDLRKQENAVEQLEMKAHDIQASIDLEKGPLMKLGLFHLDDGDRLLMVVHHLVIDGVSWRILFEDLETLYRQYKQGISLVLPPKTTSFKEWSVRLQEYANSDLFLREKAYWEKLEAEPVSVIVKDACPEKSHIKDKKTLSFRLNKADTERLLTRVNQAFFTEINDILLTALILSLDSVVRTTSADTNSGKFIIAVEGHGRTDIFPGVDTSRTVGWFTCVFPVILEVFPLANLARQIKEIKEQLRRVPNKGIGYGILKYLTAPGKKDGIDFQLKPQVSFNYLGQFDADVEQAFFAIARESVGRVDSPDRPLEFEIDIYGMITRKQLEMSVTFSENQYKSSTIEKFLRHFQQELQRIIHYCVSREVREQTPADFTYKHLSIDALESIMRCIKATIQDIYPLSPMQEGMFFHAQYQPTAITNFEQTSYRVRGKLDTAVIEKSLNELFRRHEMLRAVFIHKGLDRPVQVILKERYVDFDYEDVRKPLKAGQIEKQEYLRTFKEKDLKRGFDLSKDVLMRVSILQWDDEEYEFIWSNHHILMDGWCTGILLIEYTETYNSFIRSRPNRLPSLVPYRYYLQWLERQDKQESARYWASYLQGYREMARIPEKQEANSGEGYKSEELYFSLSRQETAAMNRLAEKNRLTLNTVIQTIWGILLGRYNGKDDVVFGAVVSGRPAEIPGVESIVGVFMNTVPVRICFKDAGTFAQLLHRVQKNAIESEPHHYYPLAEIQAGNILKQNLLDHILVFENYPTAQQIEEALGRQEQKNGEEENNPGISNIKVFGQSNYDFNVTIIPGEEIMIRFDYNAYAYPGDFIAVAAKDFKELLQQTAAINNSQEILVKEMTISHDLAEINTVTLVSEQGDFEF